MVYAPVSTGDYPRVAFLPDTFHEVNGVAHTSRHLEAFARRRQIPFLSIHAGPSNIAYDDGNVRIVELARGPASFELDSNLDYDPFLIRHGKRVCQALDEFKPDLIHLTGPGDMGTLGCALGILMRLPLVMSWHTSLHEYAGRRLERLMEFMGDGTSHLFGSVAEGVSLQILRGFYYQASLIMAPNQELIDLTRRLTGRPVSLMRRGVDTILFDPHKRTFGTRPFRVGYVGRLTTEKNVRFLADIGQALSAQGCDFEIFIIGEGVESGWLQKNVPNATLTGVLRGEELARAYADMDVFAFPSMTDTYGNVILEAMASGVPCVVTNGGGPKFLVQEGCTGFVARDDAEFLQQVIGLAHASDLRRRMGNAARDFAHRQSWDSVFEEVYENYASCLPAVCAA